MIWDIPEITLGTIFFQEFHFIQSHFSLPIGGSDTEAKVQRSSTSASDAEILTDYDQHVAISASTRIGSENKITDVQGIISGEIFW